MINFRNEDEPQSETVRQTLERVARELGVFGTTPTNNITHSPQSPMQQPTAFGSSPNYSATAANNWQIQPTTTAPQNSNTFGSTPPPNQPTGFAPSPTQPTAEANQTGQPSPAMQAIYRYLANTYGQQNILNIIGQSNANQSQNINPQEIHKMIFNGTSCGGMSPEFADKIAYAESRGICQNNINDYGCINKEGVAFGRYQTQEPALIDAGYMDKNKHFIPETGVKNMQEFLNSPEAQEQAMCNYLEKVDQYNKNWNNYKYLDENVQVGDINIPLTKDMMLAGTHREGAKKLNEWLNDIKIQNGRLERDVYIDERDRRRRNITNRFKEILYPPK